MYSEDDLLPISSIQHLIFCERRAMLVLLERVWEENLFTAEGRHLHERSHEAQFETRKDVRIVRGLRIRSLKLGLVGKADVVEFHRPLAKDGQSCIHGEEQLRFSKPFPVEYKRGRLRREEGYEIQLCAQALCLEEMIDTSVPHGAIFYGKTRQRFEVTFSNSLRNQTMGAAVHLHDLVRSGRTPTARYSSKCDRCSLLDLCMPKAVGSRPRVERYIQSSIRAAMEESE